MGGPGSGPGPCQACIHKDRLLIDQDLCLGSVGHRRLARKYGLTVGVMASHAERHMALSKEVRDTYRLAALTRHSAETRALAEELERKTTERDEQLAALRAENAQLLAVKRGVLDEWKQLEVANGLIHEAIAELRKRDKDGNILAPSGETRLARTETMINLIKRLEGQVELHARLKGEITDGVTVNISLGEHPDFIAWIVAIKEWFVVNAPELLPSFITGVSGFSGQQVDVRVRRTA